MAQSGQFRSAMRGFNKQDVLQYIDEITGAWDAERKELEQQSAAALAAEEQLRADAQQAQDAAKQAADQAKVAETQLGEVQQQLYDATADLAACRGAMEELDSRLQEALNRVAELEAQVNAITDQRDEAIAAVADAKAQLNDKNALQQQLTDAQHQTHRQDEQIHTLQQTIARYEKVLGKAEDAQEHMDGIVRPFIEQANKQADETLDSVQAVLAGVLAQLGELQGNVDQRRQALRRCKADSDSRLSAAFGDWLGEAKQATSSNHHFFR